MAPSALRLTGIDAYYGDSHVLQGVSLTVREGCLLGLLGRNGAGKSTCMSVVVGLLAPRSGTVELFGAPVTRLPPELIAARAPRKGKALWTLDTVFRLFPRLHERRNQMAGYLSGGEQQMLAIGRALMGNPRVLLMDEPSEGLAPQLVAEVGRTIARLKAEGQSIVLVEQNIKLAFGLADHVAILNTGRVAFAGGVAEVRDNEPLITQHLGVF